MQSDAGKSALSDAALGADCVDHARMFFNRLAATPEQVAGWRASARRHQQEWRVHLRLAQRSPYPLWTRFAQPYLRNHLMFTALVERGTGTSPQ